MDEGFTDFPPEWSGLTNELVVDIGTRYEAAICIALQRSTGGSERRRRIDSVSYVAGFFMPWLASCVSEDARRTASLDRHCGHQPGRSPAHGFPVAGKFDCSLRSTDPCSHAVRGSQRHARFTTCRRALTLI
jgi:hypothetical protein